MDKRVSRETCTERKAWRVWTRTKEACGQACGKDHFVSDGHLQALVMYLAVHREEASDPLSHRGSCRQGVQQQTNSHVTQDVESSTSSDSSRSYCCPICGLPTRVLWVACDSCDRWFHAECTDINPDNFSNLHNVDWVCMAVFNLYRPFMSP